MLEIFFVLFPKSRENFGSYANEKIFKKTKKTIFKLCGRVGFVYIYTSIHLYIYVFYSNSHHKIACPPQKTQPQTKKKDFSFSPNPYKIICSQRQFQEV